MKQVKIQKKKNSVIACFEQIMNEMRQEKWTT